MTSEVVVRFLHGTSTLQTSLLLVLLIHFKFVVQPAHNLGDWDTWRWWPFLVFSVQRENKQLSTMVVDWFAFVFQHVLELGIPYLFGGKSLTLFVRHSFKMESSKGSVPKFFTNHVDDSEQEPYISMVLEAIFHVPVYTWCGVTLGLGQVPPRHC